nr:hypothetical protein CparaKRNrm2_p071 [Cryptomonas paramecium]
MKLRLNFLDCQMVFFQKRLDSQKKLVNVYYVNNLKQRTENYFEYKLKTFQFFNKTESDFNNFFQFFTYSKKSIKVSSEFKKIHCQLKVKKKYLSGKFLIIACYFFSEFKLNFFRIRFYIIFLPKFHLNLNLIISMEIYKIKTISNAYLYQKGEPSDELKYKKRYNIVKFDNCTVFWGGKKIYNKFYQKTKFTGFLKEHGCSVIGYNFFQFLHINEKLVLYDYFLLINDKGFSENLVLIYGIKKNFFKLNKINKGEWDDSSFL